MTSMKYLFFFCPLCVQNLCSVCPQIWGILPLLRGHHIVYGSPVTNKFHWRHHHQLISLMIVRFLPKPPPVFPPLVTQSFAGPLSLMGAVAIVASILMAAAFFTAQNNRRQSSFDYGYARSDDFILNGYNYGDVAASKIVPYLESAGQVYKR